MYNSETQEVTAIDFSYEKTSSSKEIRKKIYALHSNSLAVTLPLDYMTRLSKCDIYV